MLISWLDPDDIEPLCGLKLHDYWSIIDKCSRGGLTGGRYKSFMIFFCRENAQIPKLFLCTLQKNQFTCYGFTYFGYASQRRNF